jgi:hypothetical protein
MGNQPDCLGRHILFCVVLTLCAVPVQAALISDASVVYNEGDGSGKPSDHWSDRYHFDRRV